MGLSTGKKLDKNSPYHPNNINIYKEIQRDKIPDTESLKDTYERVIPYYENNIKNLKQNVLISAHGNSIRALFANIYSILTIKIYQSRNSNRNPLVITINNQKVVNAEYLDKDRAKDLIVF